MMLVKGKPRLPQRWVATVALIRISPKTCPADVWRMGLWRLVRLAAINFDKKSCIAKLRSILSILLSTMFGLNSWSYCLGRFFALISLLLYNTVLCPSSAIQSKIDTSCLSWKKKSHFYPTLCNRSQQQQHRDNANSRPGSSTTTKSLMGPNTSCVFGGAADMS
jgi:hypothetical protein